jgi:hypothetical protein
MDPRNFIAVPSATLAARGVQMVLEMSQRCCSLSLWRVARGSKLMRLELIHGLFIT